MGDPALADIAEGPIERLGRQRRIQLKEREVVFACNLFETREARPDFGDYSAEERARVAAAVRATLELVERGEAGLDALMGVLESDPAPNPQAPDEAPKDISNTVNYGESTVVRP